MSKRDIGDSYRGSSRSSFKSRDDSKYSDGYSRSDKRDRRDRSRSSERSRRRSRSRSRERREDYPRGHGKSDTKVREMSISPQRSDEHFEDSSPLPPPPPPPRITKISIGFKTAPPKGPSAVATSAVSKSTVKPKPTVASVFNDGSDEEPEEMPPEARMRMRNIGRDTPTSVGPNSFGKTKHGFCDQKAITQKNLKAAMEEANPPKHSSIKFPSTVYKLGH